MAAFPTSPASIPPIATGPRKSSWPTVFGVIGTGMGIVTLSSVCMGLLGPLMIQSMGRLVPEGQRTALEATMEAYRWWTITASIIETVLSVALLIASVALLRRRRRGVGLGLVWAPLKLAMTVATLVMTAKIQDANMKAMTDNMPGMQNLGGLMDVVAIFTIILGALWGGGLPVAWLLWFTRSKVREEMAHWA